jgi:hypothetical protein
MDPKASVFGISAEKPREGKETACGEGRRG